MMTTQVTQSVSRRRAFAVTLSAIAVLGAASACRPALFSDREPRTQFDRYDRSRNNYAPMSVQDEFGIERPNLQGRLSRQN